MRVVIVYESMFGNTHLIADAIAKGLAPGNVVTVVPAAQAGREVLDRADLLVVGGPTHVHGMSRPPSRAAAAQMAQTEDSHLTVDSSAEGPGLRNWLVAVVPLGLPRAVLDT